MSYMNKHLKRKFFYPANMSYLWYASDCGTDIWATPFWAAACERAETLDTVGSHQSNFYFIKILCS